MCFIDVFIEYYWLVVLVLSFWSFSYLSILVIVDFVVFLEATWNSHLEKWVRERDNHKTKFHMKSSSCWCCYFDGDFLSVLCSLSPFSLRNSMISSATKYSDTQLLLTKIVKNFCKNANKSMNENVYQSEFWSHCFWHPDALQQFLLNMAYKPKNVHKKPILFLAFVYNAK